MHYNRHRYYDPHSGRFVSKDPIGLAGGMNDHVYAINPIGWIDPHGLKPISRMGKQRMRVTSAAANSSLKVKNVNSAADKINNGLYRQYFFGLGKDDDIAWSAWKKDGISDFFAEDHNCIKWKCLSNESCRGSKELAVIPRRGKSVSCSVPDANACYQPPSAWMPQALDISKPPEGCHCVQMAPKPSEYDPGYAGAEDWAEVLTKVRTRSAIRSRR